MKKINLPQIDDYSKCPNYSKYNLNSPEKNSGEFSIFKKVIFSAYRDLQNIQTIPTWPTLRSRVTREIINGIDVSDSEELTKSYKYIKDVLIKVHKWYAELMVSFPGEALINVELSAPLTSKLLITGTADIILLWQDEVTILDIVEKSDVGIHPSQEAYNSIKLHTLMWLLQHQGIEVTHLTRVIYKPDEIEFVRLKVDKLLPGKLERRLHLLATGIVNDIYYPSITSMCNKCPHRSICTW